MSVLLHIGLPKTGTTSLQAAFEGEHPGNRAFISPVSSLLDINRYLPVICTGTQSLEAISQYSLDLAYRRATSPYPSDTPEQAISELRRIIAKYCGGLVLSHEGLSVWKTSISVVDEVAKVTNDISILAYLRPMADLIISRLQQALTATPETALLSLRRSTLDPLQTAAIPFGKRLKPLMHHKDISNVNLRIYKPGMGHSDHGLIDDFSDQIGMKPLRKVDLQNESMSADAVSIAAALLNEMSTAQPNWELYRQSLSLLRKYGSGCFSVGTRRWAQIRSSLAEDLDWASSLVDYDLGRPPNPDAYRIESFADIIEHAQLHRELLFEHLSTRFSTSLDPQHSWRDSFRSALSQITTQDGQLRVLPSDFNPSIYLLENPDVAASGMDPGHHLIHHGFKEHRLGW